jgi:glucose-6-phosphate isomerase
VTASPSAQRSALTALPAWLELATHAEQMRDVHLRSLFASDPSRGERFCVEAAVCLGDSSFGPMRSGSARV